MPALANPFQSLPILYQNTAGYFFLFTLHQTPTAHTLPPIHLEHIMPLMLLIACRKFLYPMSVIRMGYFMLMFPEPYFQSNFCPVVSTFDTEYILLPKSKGFVPRYPFPRIPRNKTLFPTYPTRSKIFNLHLISP